MHSRDLRELYRQEHADFCGCNQSWKRVVRVIRLKSIRTADRVVVIGYGRGMLMPFIVPQAKGYALGSRRRFGARLFSKARR